MQQDRKPYRRSQLMLDQQVQGILINRVVIYWILCLASTGLAAWVWSVWTDPEPMTAQDVVWKYAPAWLGSMLVLPLGIADMIRTSNRFVGPVLRLRNAMKRLELGDRIEPLRTRRDDLWGELIERFNRLIAALGARRQL